MPSTVYDIARAASVSTTTVLRALWNKDDIKPVTKERLDQLASARVAGAIVVPEADTEIPA